MLNIKIKVFIILKILDFCKMEINIKILGKSFFFFFLGSLYYTGNTTKGSINAYTKKLGKEEHTLQEIIDYIEADKKTKIDLSNLVLVSHKDGKYAPIFAGCINYLGDNLVLPPNPDGYEGILEHLDEDGVEIHTFTKNGE